MLPVLNLVRPRVRSLRLAALLLLLLVLVAIPMGPVGAQQVPPFAITETIPASGTFAFDDSTSRDTFRFTFGPTTVAERRVLGTISGTMQGATDTKEKIVSRDPSFLAFNYTFQVTQICTCTVAGRRGSFTLSLEGYGDANAYYGTFEVIGVGGGELARLRGFGNLQGHPASNPRSPVPYEYRGVFFFTNQ
jgi:hypothetical protein